MENTLHLDGRQQIVLNSLDTFYVVEKGKVHLFFSEIDEQGNGKRRHNITTICKDELFMADIKKVAGKTVGFIVSAEAETQVAEFRTDKELNEQTFERINNFYEKVSSALPKVSSLELVPIDKSYADSLKHNNNCIISGASKKVEEKIRIEKENNIKRKQTDELLTRKSLIDIAGIIYTKKSDENVFNSLEGENILYDTCKILCDKLFIDIAAYEDLMNCNVDSIDVEDIARVSKFPIRSVILEENWYKSDNGPLIAYAIEDERPLALIPKSPKKYMVYDVTNKVVFPLTAKFAKEIIPRGQMFYRPFENKKLTKKDIFIFGIKSAWKRDIVRILVLTLVGTLIGLILPLLNEKIFDDYIPEGSRSQLFQVGVLIISFMIGNFFVSLMKMFATFRATNRMEYGIQAAVFDRLLNFPNKLYSMYDSGELANRAMGINIIFNTLSNVVVSVFLSSIFSLLYLWKMTGYSKSLSLVGLIMVAVTVIITLSVGLIQLKFEKKLIDISNKMAGFMYQLLLGITKIRLSSGEEKAIYRWNIDYFESRNIIMSKEKMSNIIMAFNNIINVLFSVAIYYMMIEKNVQISFGAFAGFMAAFGSFSGAMVQMAQTFIEVNRLIPIYEKAKPVLETLPEYQKGAVMPGDITGEIEISNVSFRYTEDGEDVLKNINFKIESGEYVGVVGPSGGGKSTLLKVLLGFETPHTGKVFYNDRDMEILDKRELRKKLGVVLQDGQIIAGSIYENITINNSRTPMKRVREVVKEVGLEPDIEKMSMGLYTVLMESGGTISGGQKQRILIARAIVNKPKILFFDEATSALDNVTQSIVCESLEKLKATRIVIAHRLSTIIDCDRIIVIDGGRVTEQGTYEELLANKGLFYNLTKRQMA